MVSKFRDFHVVIISVMLKFHVFCVVMLPFCPSGGVRQSRPARGPRTPGAGSTRNRTASRCPDKWG